jgi:hypothetical protein
MTENISKPIFLRIGQHRVRSAAGFSDSSVSIRTLIIPARSPLMTAASQAATGPAITSLSLTVIPA